MLFLSNGWFSGSILVFRGVLPSMNFRECFEVTSFSSESMKKEHRQTHTHRQIWWFEKSTWVSHRLIYFSNTQPKPIPAHWLSQPTTPPGPLTKTLDQILDKDLWSNSRFLSPNTYGFDGGLFLFLFVKMWGCSHVMPCCWSGRYMKWIVGRHKKNQLLN